MASGSAEVVRGVYESFGRGDVPGVLGAFDDQIEWHEAEGMPYGGTHTGPQQVAENVFAQITQDVEDFAVVPEEMLEDGERVVVLCRYTGSGAKSGKDLDLPAAHSWGVRDGKVTYFRQYIDTARFAEVVPLEDSVAA